MGDVKLDYGISIHCNWNTLSGCDYEGAIQTHLYNEDVFIKPDLSEVLNEEKASLLSPPSNVDESCELNICTNGKFKFAALTFVCSAPKIELFLSHQYEETLYGALLKDDEIDNEDNREEPIHSYRYDIEITKSGITDLILRFITSNKEILIYGIIVFVGPNPNGVTTLNFNSINLQNVEELLKSSGHKLSSNAEKCKLFLDSYNKIQSANSPSSKAPMEILNELKNAIGLQTTTNVNAQINQPISLENIIKSHVDFRISELEKRLERRLDDMEKSQNAKLDKIIELLSNKI